MKTIDELHEHLVELMQEFGLAGALKAIQVAGLAINVELDILQDNAAHNLQNEAHLNSALTHLASAELLIEKVLPSTKEEV